MNQTRPKDLVHHFRFLLIFPTHFDLDPIKQLSPFRMHTSSSRLLASLGTLFRSE
jgi:hypothetical protein